MKFAFEDFTKGCTGLSWLLGKFNLRAPGEFCCDEHDVAYDQGGTLRWKLQMDRKIFTCVRDAENWLVAGAYWLAITFNPYSYWVWFRAERGL